MDVARDDIFAGAALTGNENLRVAQCGALGLRNQIKCDGVGRDRPGRTTVESCNSSGSQSRVLEQRTVYERHTVRCQVVQN